MSDQQMPLRTREGTSTHAVEAHSLTGNVWWLLPPAAALFYPLALRALYESGKLLHRASGPPEALAWLAIVVSVGFVYSVPAVGIGVAYLLGQHERTSSSDLLARRLAHLVVASPSLFVLIGVVFYLLHYPNGDSVFWWILWLTVLAAAAWSMRRQYIETLASSRLNLLHRWRLVDQVAQLPIAAMSELLKYEFGQHTVRAELCSVINELQQSVLALLTDEAHALYVNHQGTFFEFGVQAGTQCP
jgi:hypothetical protein